MIIRSENSVFTDLALNSGLRSSVRTRSDHYDGHAGFVRTGLRPTTNDLSGTQANFVETERLSVAVFFSLGHSDQNVVYFTHPLQLVESFSSIFSYHRLYSILFPFERKGWLT